ncbi:MAG: hypothetical protein A2404_14900 [Bdellovibrionales bacterium RIFOXYC1_FULL_39_130]|nr:MAG: hypothetical protein A2404_14900 [Bdellovibrionales bacterium RIFOXYC1_FULL_39_130]
MAGKLTLIPTPIDEETPLDSAARTLLLSAFEKEREKSIFAIEDIRPGRRRWLRFGLPREAVDNLVQYNEHTREKESGRLIELMQQGMNVYLMSDGGLPAFCDPGQELVALCHHHKIKVTASSFANSTLLALALSGFSHKKFVFEGFLSAKKEERFGELERLCKDKRTIILMDTPYRLKQLLEDLSLALEKQGQPDRRVFLALDLNAANEALYLGTVEALRAGINYEKREFILVLDCLRPFP